MPKVEFNFHGRLGTATYKLDGFLRVLGVVEDGFALQAVNGNGVCTIHLSLDAVERLRTDLDRAMQPGGRAKPPRNQDV